MSKFTIEVADDVAVAPLAKMLAKHGYRLKWQPNSSALVLTESPERSAEISDAHAARLWRRIQAGLFQ